jgi:hydrogenase/urease accessory protein HupE
MTRARLAWLLSALAVLGAAPRTAHAHLVNTGFGPFYDGITHLFVSPADVITVLAIAMFAGLRGIPPARYGLFLLTGAWILGAFASLPISTTELQLPILVAMALLVAGLLVATDLRLPTSLVVACAAAVGLIHGVLNGTAMAEAGGGVRGVLGIAVAVFTVASITTAAVVTHGVGRPRIVVRVAGSWIAAIGFLMAGWALKPG